MRVRHEVSPRREARRLLELAMDRGALTYGDFVLSSGQKAHYYFDGRLLTLDPEGAYLVSRLVLEVLKSEPVDAVGGPTLGADPMVATVALTSHLQGAPLPAFIVRSEAKGYGTKRLIEGALMAGSRVAILDDVCTTGSSLFHAIKAVEEADCRVARVIVILDRHQGGSDELRRRGYLFTAFMEATPDGRVEVAQWARA